MAELTVSDYMTAHPACIDHLATLRAAVELMAQHKIRHLPVMKGREVVGIISERDVRMFLGVGNVNPDHIRTANICQGNPYVVTPEAPLAEVAHEMAAKHYGSAIVMKGGELAGIFTTTDACRALAALAAR